MGSRNSQQASDRPNEWEPSMKRNMDRDARALADACWADWLSRRAFVMRLLVAGVSAPIVAGLAREIRPAEAADLKGKVRFLVGPWSDGEIDHHKHIAKGFNALHPGVEFDFRLYQWDTA